MYKYTYILSDSYRQNQMPIHPTGSEYRQQLQNQNPSTFDHSINRPRNTSASFTNQSFNLTSNSNNNYNLNNANRQRANQNVRKFNYQINSSEMLVPGQNMIPRSVVKPSQNKSSAQATNQQKCLNNRLLKLTDLSERHSEALKQVQLQNKLKTISNKYKEKSNEGQQNQRMSYENYKNERKQLKRDEAVQDPKQQYEQKPKSSVNQLKNDYSFNILPQTVIQQNKQREIRNVTVNSYKNNEDLRKNTSNSFKVQPENDITRKTVKNLITNHLQIAKLDRDQFNHHAVSQKDMKFHNFERISPIGNHQIQNIQKESEKGRKAVQKLSSLQQKIKASVQPYLNI